MKNALAIVLGLVLGSIVNMGLVQLGMVAVPPPEGFDPTDSETIAETAHLLESRHFVFPFLAHALGTLVGAYIAARVAASNGRRFAIGIGAFFLLGGIIVATMIPAPTWFLALDLTVAYLPMGWLGGRLGAREPA